MVVTKGWKEGALKAAAGSQVARRGPARALLWGVATSCYSDLEELYYEERHLKIKKKKTLV